MPMKLTYADFKDWTSLRRRPIYLLDDNFWTGRGVRRSWNTLTSSYEFYDRYAHAHFLDNGPPTMA